MGLGGPSRSTVLLTLFVATSGCIGLLGPEGRFVDVAEEAGIGYVVDGTMTRDVFPMDRLGGGIAVGDVNQDGWPDLYVADAGPNVLYLNEGDVTFRDATDAWNASDDGTGRAPALFDMDNDGDLDLFIANDGDPSRLFENTGEGFRDVTEASGIELETQAVNVAVTDVDSNGHLDLFVGVYTDHKGAAHETWTSAENGGQNRLYLNQGGGVFEESAGAWDMNTTRWTLASSFADFDRDGDQDLYVANDFGWDSLFVNQGDRFVEQAHERGIEVNTNGMGVVWFDADGDADLDIYVTAIYVPGSPVPAFEGNDLLLNDDGRFTDATDRAGVADGGWSWHVQALDVENDGDEDLYVLDGFHSRGAWDVFYDAGMRLAPEAPPNAIMHGQYNETHEYYFVAVSGNGNEPPDNPLDPMTVSQGSYQTNRLFLAEGDATFEEASEAYNVDLIGDGRAAVAIDHDRDGDQDMVVTSASQPIRLLENRVGDATGAHWLQVALDPGPDRPATAPGSLVEVELEDRTLVRQVLGASGFLSQSEAIAHVGLGAQAEPVDVTVTWPWGEVTEVEDVAVDQRVTLTPEGIR